MAKINVIMSLPNKFIARIQKLIFKFQKCIQKLILCIQKLIVSDFSNLYNSIQASDTGG